MFQARFRPNELTGPRLGLVVSKRVSVKAVERNRIKRLIRESFRLTQGELGPLDVVVIARTGAAGESNPLIFKALESLWRRVAANARRP